MTQLSILKDKTFQICEIRKQQSESVAVCRESEEIGRGQRGRGSQREVDETTGPGKGTEKDDRHHEGQERHPRTEQAKDP